MASKAGKKSFEVFEVKIDEPTEPPRTDYNRQGSADDREAANAGQLSRITHCHLIYLIILCRFS